jgi:hypothetical protein
MILNRFLLTSFLLFGGMLVWAQSPNDLTSIHFNDQKRGMIILGTWGLSNALIGAYGSTKGGSLESKSFHQMNMGWGLINLGIAGFGYYSALKGAGNSIEPLALLQENQNLKSILLLNTGLDVAYMATGLYLMEKDKSAIKNSGRLKGFGKSLVMQGAFLFVFDLGMYLNFNKQTKEIVEIFSKEGQIGMMINF